MENKELWNIEICNPEIKDLYTKEENQKALKEFEDMANIWDLWEFKK